MRCVPIDHPDLFGFDDAPLPPFTGAVCNAALRVLSALLRGALTREQVDAISGWSNGPELMRSLKNRGLVVECDRIPVTSKDGRQTMRGLYYLTEAGRVQVRRWLFERAQAAADAALAEAV